MNDKTDDQTNNSRRDFIRNSTSLGAGLVGATLLAQASSAAQPQAGSGSASGLRQTSAAKLRRLVEARKLFPTPVIHDAYSAKLSEHHGFQCVFAGGLPIAQSTYGIGDYGMISITELIEFASRIQGMLDIPVMADADDGGGNPLNVIRTVRSYEHAGVGGFMMEDMYGAKHVPRIREGMVSTIPAFVDKIKAALDARRDKDFVVLIRTDALSAKEPMSQVEDRVAAYAEAGADMLFVAGLPMTEVPRLTKLTGKPFMATTAQVPLATQVQNQVVLGSISVPLVSLAAGAVHKALGELKQTGIIEEFKERSLPADVQAQILDSAGAAKAATDYNSFRT